MNHPVQNFDQTVHYFTICCLILPFNCPQLKIKKPMFDHKWLNIELVEEQIFKQECLPSWNFIQKFDA